MSEDSFIKAVILAIVKVGVLTFGYIFIRIMVEGTVRDNCTNYGKTYLLTGWYECHLQEEKPK